MRYTACAECQKRQVTCAVKCPDCGLYWMLDEGTNG